MTKKDSFSYVPENRTVSLVFVGHFNPLMFQPYWFSNHDVVSEAVVESILKTQQSSVMAPNISVFNTPQLQFIVRDNRMDITALKESFVSAKDAAKKIFEGLENTTITAMGINTSSHFKMPSLAKYHEFGDRLSPKNLWKDFLKENVSGDDRKGGLLQLQMVNNKPEGKGKQIIAIEPSSRFAPGIFINCNDHYDFNETTDAETVMDVLDANFDATLNYFLKIQLSLFEGL